MRLWRMILHIVLHIDCCTFYSRTSVQQAYKDESRCTFETHRTFMQLFCSLWSPICSGQVPGASQTSGPITAADLAQMLRLDSSAALSLCWLSQV